MRWGPDLRTAFEIIGAITKPPSSIGIKKWAKPLFQVFTFISLSWTCPPPSGGLMESESSTELKRFILLLLNCANIVYRSASDGIACGWSVLTAWTTRSTRHNFKKFAQTWVSLCMNYATAFVSILKDPLGRSASIPTDQTPLPLLLLFQAHVRTYDGHQVSTARFQELINTLPCLPPLC